MVNVLSAGLFSSIQDLGRFGHRDIGVPASGSMDNFSSRLANSLLGNPSNAAVLEITMIGPKLQFKKATHIAISGANLSATLNSKDIANNVVYQVNANDILSFGKMKFGIRSYIAVKGGFTSDVILDSRSYYKPITPLDRIEKGQVISYTALDDQTYVHLRNQNAKIKSQDFSKTQLEVFAGPEFGLLTIDQKQVLLNTTFNVSHLYNRMAYQLEQTLNNELPSILTSPVLPGTVQLTPSGQLVILMRDCQTTGGYPRILQLSESAINLISQKKEGDKLQFGLRKL